MALKFRRGTTAQQSGSLAFGEPYVNTTLGTLVVGGQSGDIVLSTSGTGSTGNFGAISGSGLDITGNANIAGNVTVGGKLTIGDATSDTVNVVASLSSSLIPSDNDTFDLGSPTKIWRDLYISTGSIKMYDRNGNLISTLSATADGMKITGELSASTISGLGSPSAFSSSVVSKFNTLGTYTGSVDTRLTEIGVVSGSLILSASSAKSTNDSQDVSITNLNATSASVNTSVSALNSFSSSQLTQNSALATISGSLILTASNHEQRLDAMEVESGSYARTNSANTFNGNQTISGSLTVTQDFVVLGSSSIQNISSSTLDIGTNLIKVNVNSPSVRFGGFAVYDSGSAGNSGSFLYDSVQDEFIFVHKGNGTNVTSSHFVLGPETYDNLGNETYLINNRLPKGTGKEHLVDSKITDDGTTISLGSNVTITGSVTVSGTVDGVDVSVLNSNINSFSSSALVRLSNLESTSASLLIETANLELATASLNTSVSNINTTTASLLIETANLETFSGSTLTRLTALESSASTALSTNNTQATSITNLNSTTASLNTSVTNINSFTASMGTTSNVRFGSLGIGMAASGTSGRIDAANDVVAFSTSDVRLKENIVPIPNAIEKIRKISGNTYDWKAELKDVHGYEGNDVGVIAQEVEEVLPQLVQDRDNGYKAVKYDKLVALLIEGIKEQQQHIDNLTIQVEELKKQKGL